MYGAYHSGNIEKEIEKVKQFIEMDIVTVLPLPNDSECFARIKEGLNSTGNRIDDLDLLIATTAVSNGLVLVTNNRKHFDRINGLVVEDWLENNK
jgi:tRNA(fMet)-specific endonuclease VapC